MDTEKKIFRENETAHGLYFESIIRDGRQEGNELFSEKEKITASQVIAKPLVIGGVLKSSSTKPYDAKRTGFFTLTSVGPLF